LLLEALEAAVAAATQRKPLEVPALRIPAAAAAAVRVVEETVAAALSC